MADAIQGLTLITNNATLRNNVDVADADNINSDRLAQNTEINLHKTVLEEQESNYASATEPTNKPEGKIWADTSSDPAVLKYYKDGSSNLGQLSTVAGTESLENKTLINPTFSPAGGKSYLGLGRDLNLRITNGATATTQVAITFDNMTLYGTTGLGAVEARTSALTLTITTSGAGGRAASENSTVEKASSWYYIYVYSDGAGTINGLMALADDWATVVSNGDNPSGSDFVRRIGAVRNDSSSDFLFFSQSNNQLVTEKLTRYDIGTATSTTLVSTSISSLVPVSAYRIQGFTSNSATNSYVATNNDVTSGELVIGNVIGNGSSIFTFFDIPLQTSQTMYIAVQSASTANVGLTSCFLEI